MFRLAPTGICNRSIMMRGKFYVLLNLNCMTGSISLRVLWSWLQVRQDHVNNIDRVSYFHIGRGMRIQALFFNEKLSGKDIFYVWISGLRGACLIRLTSFLWLPRQTCNIIMLVNCKYEIMCLFRCYSLAKPDLRLGVAPFSWSLQRHDFGLSLSFDLLNI